MKYYGYTRVSTESQLDGYGLEAQEASIRKYAAEHGITIEKVFTDAGVSGAISDTADDDAILKRRALIELLATVEEGDCVLVQRTDRLWRSDAAKVIVKRNLLRAGVSVISVDQPNYRIDSKNPEDMLIQGIFEIFDVYDKMNVTIKMARGRTAKAMGGDKPAGLAPLGYKYSTDRKHIEIDEGEAPTVKRIFSLATRGYSLQDIAKEINEDGIRTRRGNEFSKQAIAAILKNRFYLGELHHGNQVIEGNHTPLISRVQFGKAAAALTRRHK